MSKENLRKIHKTLATYLQERGLSIEDFDFGGSLKEWFNLRGALEWINFEVSVPFDGKRDLRDYPSVELQLAQRPECCLFRFYEEEFFLSGRGYSCAKRFCHLVESLLEWRNSNCVKSPLGLECIYVVKPEVYRREGEQNGKPPSN